MRMVIISLGCNWAGRPRRRLAPGSWDCSHSGTNRCQNSSTAQNTSSILMAIPPDGLMGCVTSHHNPTGGISIFRTHVNLVDLLLVTALAEHWRRRGSSYLLALLPGVLGFLLADGV